MNWKSLLLLVLFSVGCTGWATYVNLVHGTSSIALVQPNWLVDLHIGAALLGSLLFALFVAGTPTALRGPASSASYGIGVVPRAGAVRFFIPANGAFFSATRIAQIFGVLICLMIQFISVGPLNAGNHAHGDKVRPVKLLRGQLTA